MSAVIRAQDLTKSFFRKGREQARSFDAVSSVDLELHAGRLTACMGRSGSGKTTLLNMLAGLLEPTSGMVEFDGVDLYGLDDAQRSRLRSASIGVVPQGQTPLLSLTLVQNVMLPAGLYAHALPQDLETQAMDLLEEVGLRELADSYPAELSGGELRRMTIARALLCSPRVLLADEPTGDLDAANTACVLGLLRQAANRGAAVLVVSHDREVLDAADGVVRMEAGRLQSSKVDSE